MKIQPPMKNEVMEMVSQLSPLFRIIWLHTFKTYLLIEMKFYKISIGLCNANPRSIYNIWFPKNATFFNGRVYGCNCHFYSDSSSRSHIPNNIPIN